jgi:FMN phosphatase YigB (HAD superfamily)
MTDQELIQTIIESLASAVSTDADWGDIADDILYDIKKHRKEQYEKTLKRYERDFILSKVTSLNQDIERLESEKKRYDSIIESKKQELETVKTKIK